MSHVNQLDTHNNIRTRPVLYLFSQIGLRRKTQILVLFHVASMIVIPALTDIDAIFLKRRENEMEKNDSIR